MAGLLTLAMIKPHIYLARKAGKIIERIEQEGFGILQCKVTQFQRSGAEEFYAEHRGKDFFPNLVRVMSSAPIWVLVLSKPNAVQEWRDLIGTTNPAEASPGTIRFEFGDHGNQTNNAVHGSATDHDAQREISFFFSRELEIAKKVLEKHDPIKDIQDKIA